MHPITRMHCIGMPKSCSARQEMFTKLANTSDESVVLCCVSKRITRQVTQMSSRNTWT